MPIEFTHVPGKTHPADAGSRTVLLRFRRDGDKAVADRGCRLPEDRRRRSGRAADQYGLAAQALDRTSSLEVVLTHWAGVIEPTVAARQLAALDAKSGGRLSLRMLSEPLNDDDAETRPVGHTVVWQRIDEYLVLLKRLWSNDRPFDHEGAFYSIKGGYVPRKGPHGADVDHPHGRPVRNGAQGRRTACRCLRTGAGLARRDPPADGAGAQRCRRTWPGRQAAFCASGPDSREGGASAAGHKAVELSGPPAQVALSLLALCGAGHQ